MGTDDDRVLPRPLALLVALVASVLVALSCLPANADPEPPPATSPTSAAPDTADATAADPAPRDAAPPDAAPAPAAPPAAAALTVTGRSADGWVVYRLADDRLPSRLLLGLGFRGEVHFVHDGRARAVRVLVPPSAPRPAPLLLALHGMYQTPKLTEDVQRWGPLVRREGVVLVYGMGTSASWNAGTCCGRAVQEGVDDVGYLDAVRRLVDALAPLDPRRQYLTGFSNGAMMAYRYACERPGVVAGVLAVAGTVTASCTGRADVAVLHVHGVADRTVPLEGLRYSAALRTPLRPVSRTATMFGPTITARLLPRYGHGWPTRARGGFATTEAGWAWLEAHPRRAAAATGQPAG